MKAVAYIHAYVDHGHNAGAETTMHDLLRAMVKDDWEVEVILSCPQRGITQPYTVDGVLVTPFSDPNQLITAVNQCQLLITHLENSDRVGIVGKMYRCPVVQVIHNDMDITKGYIDMGCDLAVFNTAWVRDSFAVPSGRYGAPTYSGPKVVMHPRIDLKRFVFPKGHRKSSQRYITLVNLWSGTSAFGQRSGKGTEVFYAMAERFPEERFLGVIGGYGEQDIRKVKNVTIQMHTHDMVKDVYAKTKLILMPSHYESFGRVAIEAAALGIPSVVSPTPGLVEAMGDAGLYAALDNLDEWELHIASVLNDFVYPRRADLVEQRAEYWYDKQPEELALYLDEARRLGEMTLALRGW